VGLGGIASGNAPRRGGINAGWRGGRSLRRRSGFLSALGAAVVAELRVFTQFAAALIAKGRHVRLQRQAGEATGCDDDCTQSGLRMIGRMDSRILADLQ